MNIFNGCINPTQAKEEYTRLIQANTYPLGELTTQYLSLLQTFHGKEYTGVKADKTTYTYRYQVNPQLESQFIEIVQALCSLQMPSVNISVRGTWLWIEGETKPFTNQLKQLRCRQNSRRSDETGMGVYNWTPIGVPVKYKYRSKLSHNDIKMHYGNTLAVK